MKEKMLNIIRLAIEKELDYQLRQNISFALPNLEDENQIGDPLIYMNLKSLVGHNFYIWIDIEYGEYRKNPSGFGRSPVESSAVYYVYTKYVKEEIEKGDWIEIKDLVDKKRGIQKEMNYLDAVKSNVDTIDIVLEKLES